MMSETERLYESVEHIEDTSHFSEYIFRNEMTYIQRWKNREEKDNSLPIPDFITQTYAHTRDVYTTPMKSREKTAYDRIYRHFVRAVAQVITKYFDSHDYQELFSQSYDQMKKVIHAYDFNRKKSTKKNFVSYMHSKLRSLYSAYIEHTSNPTNHTSVSKDDEVYNRAHHLESSQTEQTSYEEDIPKLLHIEDRVDEAINHIS